MRSRLVALVALVGAFGLGSCSSSSSNVGGLVHSGGSTGSGSGGANGSGGATTGATGGGTTTGSGGSVIGTGGAAGGSVATGGGSVASGGTSAGSGGTAGLTSALGGAPQAGASGANGGAGGGGAVAASAGCGKAPLTAASTIGSAAMGLYGKFMITVNAQSVLQFNAMPGMNQAVMREYFVRLPDNYDNTKPYRVIYQGPGCGVTQDSQPTMPHAQPQFASDPNSTGARTGAILVQMQQGAYNPAAYNPANCTVANMSGCNTSSVYCFDDWASEAGTPQTMSIPDGSPSGAVAMEKAYFGALHKAIEDAYCVDKSREFYSGYSSGGWLAQQLGCWFPDVLRAQANVTGGIPPIINANPSYCVQHPIAYFSIHNNPDPSNAFQGSVDGAKRVFALNGCTGTFPTPPPPGAATIPAGLEAYQITDSTGKVLIPNNSTFRCYHYTTCPAAYPMYFCVSALTTGQHDAQGANAAPAFWQFFSRF